MFKAVVFSSLYISLAAISLSLFYQFIGESIHLPRTIIIGLGTFISYNIVQILPLLKRPPISERGRWIQARQKALWFLIGASTVGIGLLSQFLGLKDILNFSHLLLLSLLYEGVVLRKGLRSIPFFKPFLISYVWAMTCAFPVFGTYTVLPTIECFLFIFSLCLLFDLRDVQDDLRQNIKTFANRYGSLAAKMLSVSSLLASVLLLLMFTDLSILLLTSFLMLGIVLISTANERSSDLYYLYLVDGLILVKLFLLLEAF